MTEIQIIATVVGIGVAFLLAAEPLVNHVINPLRCAWARGHRWGHFSRMGMTQSCRVCPAVRDVVPTNIAEWRRRS